MTPDSGQSASSRAGARTTPTLYLVRHGKAMNRTRWDAPDSARPLTKRGIEQSRLIAGHLLGLVSRPPSRVLSSPADDYTRRLLAAAPSLGEAAITAPV